jgi:exopolysaccharide production protein ExoQ
MIADRFISEAAFDGAGSRASARPLLWTPALVGFYFSFRTAVVLIAARLLLVEPQVGAAVGLAIGFVLFLVVGFQSAGPATQPLRWVARISTLRWVVAYLVFAASSFAWGGAVSLPSSFLYWCGVATDVGIVVLMLRTGPVEQVAHSVIKGFIASTCVLATIAWLMPAQADLRLGDPDFFNTNQIGNLCAFAVLLAQYLTSRKDGRWGIAAMFLTITVVRSLSKTTLVAFFLSEGLLLMRDKAMRGRTKLLMVAVVLAAGLLFWGLYESYYDVYTTAGNQAETLTGRTAIWAYALTAAVAKPWFGNGFDALWKVMPPFGPDQFEARHAENELLQQFFAYGVVGVVLLIGVYGSLYRRMRRLAIGPTRLVLTAMLLFIVIRGFAEAEPFDLLLPLWAIALFSATLTAELDSMTAPDSPFALRSTSVGLKPLRNGAL